MRLSSVVMLYKCFEPSDSPEIGGLKGLLNAPDKGIVQ